MIIEADDDVLSIKINEKEWRDVFIMNDGAYIDVFVGSDNIDVLFPGWREYVNPNNILVDLDCSAVERFNKLNLTFDETVGDKEGEGIYTITGYEFFPSIDDEEEEVVVGIDEEFEMIMMITIHFGC